jgi:hypothetical protein
VQLSLSFLPTQQPPSPLSQLSEEQRAELVEALARVLTKAAGNPVARQPAPPLSANREPSHD